MHRVALRAGAAFVLGLGLVSLPTLAEDTKPAKEPPPNWSGYVFVADVVGEVVKSNDKSVTLRVTWFEPQQAKNGGNGNKGGNNNRPRLGQNNRNFRNPFAANMNRPNQPQVQWKEQHHDYELEFVPESLVRTKALPPKLDEKGKKVAYTQKEVDEFRSPAGVPGYAAARTELVPGTIVEVILVRDKTVPAAKAGEDDLRVKYAIIQGKDPNPPKDIANAKNEKKKDKN